ncbi:MAG: 50S ribosomal protein L19e [Candidatus Aenigmarchaeota archaeon]|nr:50S ribosomal protein L19e [Candidatus Aenigmarchaeota archaeon]
MKAQRRLAAEILKVGESKIWFDPTKISEIEKAVTKADVRKLIEKGYIKVRKEKLKKPKEKKKKRRYEGSKKGGKYSIVPRKRRWITLVRSLREFAKELKKEGKIDNKTYRLVRRWIKGGMFKSKMHMKLYLEQHKLIKGE